MKKTVLFVLLDLYADWEAAYLAPQILDMAEEQYEVKTVSLNKEPKRSLGGFTTVPDYGMDSIPEDLDVAALILIGGMSWRKKSAQKVKPLVHRAIHDEIVLGGICDASVFLGTTGALNSAKHTSNDLNDLKQWAGKDYTGELNYRKQQAVRDQNIVTANGSAPLEFAMEVLIALEVAPESKILEWYHFHKLGYFQHDK